ncbi:hypothetical protein [Belliella alkalica]|nr:hypothetical protein [Belliella alkalica]
MKVKLISDYGLREKTISKNAELAVVIDLIDQLDWNFFYQIVIEKDSNN